MQYKKDLISVIVPVYNAEKYLARCLDSILANTYKNLEIICVNDGSTDHCPDILNNYKAEDPRIIVIDKPNGGVSSARNSGLRISAGEYISFIDSDDWVHPCYFEYLYRAIVEHDADMSMCDYVRTDRDDILKDSKYKSSSVTIRQPAIKGFSIGSFVWRRLFRHSIVEQLLFDDNEKIEDMDYLLRLFIQNPHLKIANISLTLYAYYNNKDSSLSSNITNRELLELAEKYASYIDLTDFKVVKAILAEITIKRVLPVRLIYIATKNKKGLTRCNNVLRKCLPYKPTISYTLLALFPTIYRLIVTILDPTMLPIEKNQTKDKLRRLIIRLRFRTFRD